MHSNLRILYVLILITAVTGGVWLYTQPEGQLASIAGTDFAVADTSKVDKIFIADMDGKSVTLTRPEQGRLVGFERTLQSARRRGHPAFENLQARGDSRACGGGGGAERGAFDLRTGKESGSVPRRRHSR